VGQALLPVLFFSLSRAKTRDLLRARASIAQLLRDRGRGRERRQCTERSRVFARDTPKSGMSWNGS